MTIAFENINSNIVLHAYAEYSNTNPEEMWDRTEGIILAFTEEGSSELRYLNCYYDPQDGYRSTSGFFVTDDCPENIRWTRIPPQESILIRNTYEEGPDYDENGMFIPESCYDGIEVLSRLTGRVIVSVGTDYSDSYYPVGNMTIYPENLDMNVIACMQNGGRELAS